MERRLYEAAMEGNAISLLELLQEDPLMLDRSVATVETPLHIAAILGHLTFAKEILSRKSELAGEFDSQRRSPLHLASAKGDVEIVKLLLSINPNVCLTRDRDGRTPLHLAAMKDRIQVLNELISAKPEACWVRDDRGETILHLCIKHNSFEALKLLVNSVNDDEFVNLKDDDGNTLLHLAVLNKQLEILKFLLNSTQLKVNALNAYGFTALDILSQSPRDLKDMDILESLQQAGAMREKDGRGLRKNTTNDQSSNLVEPLNNSEVNSTAEKYSKKKEDWVRKKRNSLMVVASLIATMAFQSGINPPGGLWQDTTQEHTAGTSIMATNNSGDYNILLVSNTMGFIASLSVVFLLISGLPLKRKFFVWVLMVIMWIAITSMAISYLVSINTLKSKPQDKSVAPGPPTPSRAPSDSSPGNGVSFNLFTLLIVLWIGLMSFLLLGGTIRLVVRFTIRLGVKLFGRFSRRVIQPSNSWMKRNCTNV
ncbi:ankyrin repeat-containing protein BDA1-like [Macadamia integrifolia]|uniref:ankyrin repeat-containing protein BDA1-like n=1 Tax=Macadamia integrifolia TaxID=60698 RepID=UPI001C4E875C|nr:ankyrin repeat-containing protein BDA1-like [Macadamia integrifolia]